MDYYRPDYRLDRLRMMLDGSSRKRRRDGEPLLHLRWLRTMVVDLSRTPEERPQDALDRLALQRRSAVGCAVERVVCKAEQGALGAAAAARDAVCGAADGVGPSRLCSMER